MDHEDAQLIVRPEPGPSLALDIRPEGVPRWPALGRAMTRCECAEVAFDDVARQVARGESLQEVSERTGCGRNCSACVDDLLRHLHARRACRH